MNANLPADASSPELSSFDFAFDRLWRNLPIARHFENRKETLWTVVVAGHNALRRACADDRATVEVTSGLSFALILSRASVAEDRPSSRAISRRAVMPVAGEASLSPARGSASSGVMLSEGNVVF
jgi:hypothetical protein